MQLTEAQIEKLRQSGIRLDAEGRFWHEGEEVLHEGLRAAFWRWLDRNPDGRHVLRLDERRFVYLEVDDAPYLVRSLRWEGPRAWILLSDGSESALDCATLRLGPTGIAYAIVKRGLTGRLSSSAWSALSERMTSRDGGIWLNAEGGPFHLGDEER